MNDQPKSAGGDGAAMEREHPGLTCTAFAKQIIEGTGGMNSFEEHELPAWFESDRVEAAKWTLKCLANPACEGSEPMGGSWGRAQV